MSVMQTQQAAKEAQETQETVVISSLLVETEQGMTNQVASTICKKQGVEVHGVHGVNLVVSIEAADIDSSYAIAAELGHSHGVMGVQLVYANFEDDPDIRRKLNR